MNSRKQLIKDSLAELKIDLTDADYESAQQRWDDLLDDLQSAEEDEDED